MTQQRPRRRQAALVLGVLVGAIGLVAVTWIAASAFVSPEQRAAGAKAPPVQPVVASVTRGDLVDIRTLPAEVVTASARSVTLPTQGDDARTVVTGVFIKPGADVVAGGVILETNGSPVFALKSAFPFYRDIGVDNAGPDVEALQQNLVELGLLGSADGKFGARTAAAVAALYARAGYAPPVRVRESADEPAAANPSSASSASSATEATPTAAPKYAFVPLSAMLAVPETPTVVQAVPARGTVVTDETVVALGSSGIEVVGTVSDSLVGQIKAGMHAVITLPGGEQVPAVTDRLESLPSDAGAQQRVALRRADGTAVDAALVGEPVSVRITIATVAEDALIVPLVAVSGQSDGEAVVLVKSSDGNEFVRRRVQVTATLGGSAAVADDGTITVGDQVRVG